MSADPIPYVLNLPGSEVGHLPVWKANAWALCNDLTTERAFEALRRRNIDLMREHQPTTAPFVPASGLRACKRCVRIHRRITEQRDRSIDAMCRLSGETDR